MARQIFTLLLLVLSIPSAESQIIKAPAAGAGIVYDRESSIQFRLSTNRGLAIGAEFGKLRTYYKTTFYQVSLGEIRHPKEQRQSPDPQVGRSFRSYIYGKRNNLLALRAGWGVKRYFSEKAKQKGVALGVSYTVGPTLGLLKPYHLALCYPSTDNPGACRIFHQSYSEENALIFLDEAGRIKGASAFTRGFKDISLTPGGNASAAIHMDWGAFDEVVKALEVGVMLDVFAQKTPILVSEENQRVFLNFFINMQFGKRR